jgi:hypothetical protein
MKSLLLVPALAAALFAGAASAEAIAIDVPDNIEPPRSTLTRAEVLADFHLWRLAGLQDLHQGEAGVDTNSYEYRRALATYGHLRASPQYAALVVQLQQNPGATVVAKRHTQQLAQQN